MRGIKRQSLKMRVTCALANVATPAFAATALWPRLVYPMPQFTMGGPSVRVTANDRVEFKWITDVAWVGAGRGVR